MAISNNIIGQYESNLASQAGTDRVATDKDTFLKLLVAQLTHQDPLNPVEDKEFIAQLAQFTQVEELQNINSGVETLNDAYLKAQATNAASLINTIVVAGGDNMMLKDAANFVSEDDFPAILYTLPRESAGGTLTIWSTNSDGTPQSPVYSTVMPAASAGRHEIKWHGRNDKNQVMPDGSYIVSVTAKDAEGKDILVNTLSEGLVTGVETKPDGNHLLYLHDGRTVSFNDIGLILGVYNNGGTPDPEPEGGGEGGDGEGEGEGEGEGGDETP